MRGSWQEISGDSEIWKKLLVGSACLLFILPIPVALGALAQDFEDEYKKIKEDSPPGKLPGYDNPAGLLGKGLAPSFILFLAMMLYCLPTVVVLMSSAQTYAWVKSEHGLNVLSFLVTAGFGFVALAIQFLCTIIFPIALAQYGRGMSLKPAIDPMKNLGFALEMGAPYWIKASGYWFFLLASMVLFIQGISFWVDLPLRLALGMLGLASLFVSGRYALHQLQTRL